MSFPADLVLWEFIRAAGILAYVLLSISVMMGIGVKARAMDGMIKRPWVYEAHQSITIAAFASALLHMALLLLNSHVQFSLATLLLPFASSWKPLPVALGIAAFWLMLVLVASSYTRGLIGQTTWRALHYGGFVAWVVALGHGLTAGSDSGLAWLQWIYLGSLAGVFFLLVYRLLLPSPRRAAGRA